MTEHRKRQEEQIEEPKDQTQKQKDTHDPAPSPAAPRRDEVEAHPKGEMTPS